MELSPKLATYLDIEQVPTDNKKIERRSYILSDHHMLKLNISNKSNRELTNLWCLNTSLLKEKLVKTQIKK